MPVIGNELECSGCKRKQPDIHFTNCFYCGDDLGAPNVNIVSTSNEIEALEKRYQEALIFSEKSDTDKYINKFESYFQSNVKAIINLSLPALYNLVKGNKYKNYYRSASDGDRPLASFEDDKKRNVIDSIFFGIYSREIVFAALTLNTKGLISYGPCSLIIDENSIKSRASTLEENSYDFFKNHDFDLEKINIPPGYRSRWTNKNQLAVAKLHKLVTNENEIEYCDLILFSDGDRNKDKFIEVHIYKEISKFAFSCIYVPHPRNRDEDLDIKFIEQNCPGKVVRY